MGILDRMKLRGLESFLDEARNRDEAIREAGRHEEAIFNRLGRGPFSLEELLMANRELRNRVDNRFPPLRGEAPAPKLPALLARQFERLSGDIVRDVKEGKLPLGHAEDFQKSFFEQLGPELGDASPGRLFLKTGKEVRPIRIAQRVGAGRQTTESPSKSEGEILELKVGYTLLVPDDINKIIIKTRPNYLGPDGIINLSVQEINSGKSFGTKKVDQSHFVPAIQAYEIEMKAAETGLFQLIANIPGGGQKVSEKIKVKGEFGLLSNRSSWTVFVRTETQGKKAVKPTESETFVKVDGVYQNPNGKPQILGAPPWGIVRKIADGTSFILEDSRDKKSIVLKAAGLFMPAQDFVYQNAPTDDPDKRPGWKDEGFRHRQKWEIPPTLSEFEEANQKK